MKPQTLSRTVSSHVFVNSPRAFHVAESDVWPRWPALFLLLGLLLSLSVSAARLELDRKELLVGEVTTVHLKGKPFIALVDWKVSPELEIIDSDKDHAQVRGIREGSGSVICEMNLSVHTIEIKVRAAAKATPPPAYAPPVVSPPAPASVSPPPPAYQAPALTASQSGLAGTWRINANGYTGKLELGGSQGMLIGRVWFDAHKIWEPLAELYFDDAIGELSFTRPGAHQFYRGRLQQDTLEGRFNQWSGRDYSANAPSYAWSASRSNATASAPPPQAATGPAAIAELAWQGMDQDKVGDWGNGRPNGTPDGGFRLTLDLPDKQFITSISLWGANDKGEKAGGHVWHSRNSGYWMLGVFRDGRQVNPSHVASLGEFSGKVILDLYANASGLFNPGQTFLLEVETSDGKVLSRALKIEAQTGSDASLSLSRDRYAPGDAIVVNFKASADYADNAWIGIIPSRVPHGSEAENDRHDLSYQYLGKRTSGSMTFIAPKDVGDYDLRMHDSDNNGREVASVSFRVAVPSSDGGRGQTAQPATAPQGAAPGTDDGLKDVMNQLQGVFGR